MGRLAGVDGVAVDLLAALAGGQVVDLPEQPGYLPNPGMGYQGWTDSDGSLPTAVEYRRGPHPDQGGFDWASLNPAQGVYDWARIDTVLAQADGRGEQLSFRVITMLGDEFGGNCVPGWVTGLVVLDADEPDYRCRAYQQHWGTFVDALAARYDGDPRIAFIDISGYGLFNEWQDNPNTTGDVELGDTVDALTRRHLIHMYVGGSGTAGVVESNGVTTGTLAYSHPGFQQTQLIMTYGGIWSSSRYVLDHYPHVGFRNDALLSDNVTYQAMKLIGHGIEHVWRRAPVMFEPITGASSVDYPSGRVTMQGLGACVMHDNSLPNDAALETWVERVGYRYHCRRVRVPDAVPPGGPLLLETWWTNTGFSRAYPRMGQDFTVALAVAADSGAVLDSWETGHDVSDWLPGENRAAAVYTTADYAAGWYTLLVGVINRTTDTRILLPLDADGRTDRWYPTTTFAVGDPAPPGPAAVLADTFTRANSATTMGSAETGQAWAPVSSTWGITGNQAYTTSTSAVTTLVETGINDLDARLTAVFGTGGTTPWLVFRALDNNNRMGLVLDVANSSLELWRNNAGNTGRIGTTHPIAGGLSAGVPYTMRVVAVGTNVTAYLDGAQVFQATITGGDATKFVGAAGYTKVGLRGTSHSRFDDLQVFPA